MINSCWICGKPADSGEHRIKQSDMRILFGVNIKNELLLFTDENKVSPLQSYNSRFLKSKVLCKICNSTKTQPYDMAYEKFIQYVTQNKKEIIYKRFIDFSRVYGDTWEREQVNLYKYFVKSFGTRLVHYNKPIPADMIGLFDKKIFQTALRITFAVNENILKMCIDKNIQGGIGNGSIQVNQSYIDGSNDILYYLYCEHYDWLDIYYYNHSSDGALGSTWVADNQFIYLGCSYDTSMTEAVILYNLKKIKWFSFAQWELKKTSS